VRPIPTAFHIGPLEVHSYGIGLAITFWFAYRYFAKRLRDNGYPDAWLSYAFVWIIASAIVGARVVHVIANFNSLYRHDLIGVFEVWHGGLSSYGGLLFAFPVGLWIVHKRCPELRAGRAVDILAPVLVAAWALGRLLGPQLEVNGGGRPTNAWYGMYYAGTEVGKRLPVPIFQAIECFVIYLIILQVEKYTHARGNRPVGLVMAAGATLWGLSRFVDERFWLTQDNGTDAVEVASLAFVGVGLAYIGWRVWRDRRQGAAAAPEEPASAVTAAELPAETSAETAAETAAEDGAEMRPQIAGELPAAVTAEPAEDLAGSAP
jgi:phosphatidylglycerol:prolipoprotein diacylglycerol transferase